MEKLKMKNADEEYMLQKTAMFFSVLGDTGRIKIIKELCDEELCVNHLAVKIGASQSAVSHQLSILKQNDIVKFRRDGKNVFYSLDDEHVRNIFQIGLEHVQHK
jgi:ArsR family transcriptional regulator